MATAITVSDLSKRFRLYHERNNTLKATVLRRRRVAYEEFWALRDVSLEVPLGSTYGLIGENGSGKSTLLKCMARILTPDAGRVAVDGKISALLELGAGFHPELSGRENVFLNGSILGMSQRQLRSKLDEIVGFAGLERFIDSPVKNYSSGMYVRLGFAVAINVDPDVLLIDEVLAVGDEQFQRRCQEKFSELKSQGKTIVVVSHALETVRSMCDELAWLDHGVVREIGPASKVVDRYLSEVHVEQATPESPKVGRAGSQEATIERVELLDDAGEPTARFQTNAPFRVRVHYAAPNRIEQPVFAVGIWRIDGIRVSVTNMRDTNQVPDAIEGTGTVEFAVPRLPLLAGTYDVTVALHDVTGLHIYDSRRLIARFDVTPGEPRESSAGFVTLGGRWQMAPDRTRT